jgi:hypothetical protein
MTQDELKRIGKKINLIQDPLGKGFPFFRRILQDMATIEGTTELTILQEYMNWKSSHI